MTRRQVDRIKRLEAAHANAVENFPLFVGAMVSSFDLSIAEMVALVG
jgi:uncharacterized MAPEG superfamily protein